MKYLDQTDKEFAESILLDIMAQGFSSHKSLILPRMNGHTKSVEIKRDEILKVIRSAIEEAR